MSSVNNNGKNTQRIPVEIPKEEQTKEAVLTLDEYVAQDGIQRNVAAGMRVLYGGVTQTLTAWKDVYTAFLSRNV